MTILGRCQLKLSKCRARDCTHSRYGKFGCVECAVRDGWLRTAVQGFTLVEVMIIVAIIGILASIAIPMYADYSIRTKMSEVILAASACRTAITEVYQGSNTAPGAGNWGCEGNNKSNYVLDVTTNDDGAVIITVRNVNPAVDGLKIQMVPYRGGNPATISNDFGNGINEWRCGPAPAPTGVDRKYLPSSCRS